jgi:hypothetical protein
VDVLKLPVNVKEIATYAAGDFQKIAAFNFPNVTAK